MLKQKTIEKATIAFEQALALHQQGQSSEAEALCKKILKRQPKHFSTLNLLSGIELTRNNLPAALAYSDRAVEIAPNNANVYYNRGLILEKLMQHEDALENYNKTIILNPVYIKAYHNRGVIFYRLKKYEAALATYDKIIELNPTDAKAYSNRGAVLCKLDQYNIALTNHDKAIELNPYCAQAYNNLGVTLTELKQYNAALATYKKEILLTPNDSRAYNNFATTLCRIKKHRRALPYYKKSIELNPNDLIAYNNLAVALCELQQYENGLINFKKIISLDKANASAHWHQALIYLLLGNFEQGWREYEWRWENENLSVYKEKRNFNSPLWLGKENIFGKKIFIHAEQGFGDTIQFCRYARMVSDLGAQVILEAQKPLMNLLINLDGVSKLIAKGDALPKFDYYCPLLSLPLAFKTNLENIPHNIPYLKTDFDKKNAWQTKLGTKTKLRIGLAWSGSPTHKNDHNRSLALADLLKYLPNHFEYISLQKEVRDTDKEALKSVLHFGDELKDFSDTAALCECVDLIISVDTSIAHLAGALGKNIWILLPFNPDWRWLLNRTDSPWYPSAKLYRQEKVDDWSSILNKINNDLLCFLTKHSIMTGNVYKKNSLINRGNEELQKKIQRALDLYQKSQLHQAQTLLKEILIKYPKETNSLNLLGIIELTNNNLPAALHYIDRTIEIAPNNTAAYYNRALILEKLNRHRDALDSYNKVIQLNPNNEKALNNRGNVLNTLNQFEEALTSYNKAIALNHSYTIAYNNRAFTHFKLKQHQAALINYNKAIELNPHYTTGYFCRSLLYLLLGEFDQGWRDYEWRWKDVLAKVKRNFPQPLWLGKEPLTNKKILIHAEQGFGDTIQFCRYTKKISDLGAHIIFEVQKPLVNLITNLAGVSQCLARGDPLPEFDYHCPLLSLPLAFKTTIQTIPSNIPYLKSDSQKTAKWKSILGTKIKPRIGLAWSGRDKPTYDRSIPLVDLLKYLPSGFQYVSLQKGIRDIDEEILTSQTDILYFGNELTDFSDTAALCECMDMVISIDTSIAHLAGAMGKPLWILLMFNSDWRWLLDRADSPWYPSAKLYRQEKFNDWAFVLKKVQDDLLNTFIGPLQKKEPTIKKISDQLKEKLDRALELHIDGKSSEAKSLCLEILAIEPNNFLTLNLLSGIALTQNNLSEALSHINKVFEKSPYWSEAHYNKGLILQKMMRYEDALQSYRKAIDLNSDHVKARHNRDKILTKKLDHHDKAIELDPTNAKAHYHRARILQELKQYEAAMTSYDKAIILSPNDITVYRYRGTTLYNLRQYDAALASYKKAIALDPNYADNYVNYSIASCKLKQYKLALTNYKKAIALSPNDSRAHFGKSLLDLLLGNFKNGWKEYEWRWKDILAKATRNFPQPLWLGKEPLTNKTILLHAEQGLGDTIQFCRYAKMVSQLGAHVILEVQKPLVNLLTKLDGASQLIAKGDALPHFDYHCPLLSLPLAFKTELETIPSDTPYLKNNSNAWQTKLGAKTKPRIGLAWSGSPSHKNDHNRSLALADLLKYLPENFEYISLQKEVRDTDKEALKDILHFGDKLNDFSDTAALCDCMDLVISVDTSVAHLAGAMNKPTWILIPYNPDWRWLLDRTDSPWYSSAKLYRQEKIDKWSNVLEKVNSDLLIFFKTNKSMTDLNKKFYQALDAHLHQKNSESETLCSKILIENPNHIPTLNLLAGIELTKNNASAALSYNNKVIEMSPNWSEVHYNRGLILQQLGHDNDALESHKKCTTINPDHSKAYFSQGVIFHGRKQYEQALINYDKAIFLDSAYAGARWNKALLYLLLGNFNRGWQEYEWRWKAEPLCKATRNFPQPLWLGKEPLTNKTILLHAEQGLGDTIQFCRYAKMVSQLGAHVILEVQKPLMNLLTKLDGVSQLIAKGDALPSFDYHCPLLSLPLAFKTELETIPSDTPYLKSNSNAWQTKLGAKTKPLIGLAWSGSATHKNDHNRSLALTDLLKYLPENFEYISLQKEVRDTDKEALKNILHFGDKLNDFSDTAALCDCMDLIISVDTSIAHLAGALNKPTWILIPYNPDWRWLLDRTDSPWYPSVKLYRQEKMDDWASALEKVRADLLTKKDH